MKLDGRHGYDGGIYGASARLGDNGDRPERPATAAMTAMDEQHPMSPPQESCDCTDVDAHGQATTTAMAGPAAVPKTSSAVGSSLFTIDSILAPSRSSDVVSVTGPNAIGATGRNNVTAVTAAGFFKQPLNIGHFAAAAAASGYAHSTAANFLGKWTLIINHLLSVPIGIAIFVEYEQIVGISIIRQLLGIVHRKQCVIYCCF